MRRSPAIDIATLEHIATVRLQEARDIVLLFGSGKLSTQAQMYLVAVERLFMAIRANEASYLYRVRDSTGEIAR